jgi:3-oxochol-4-en-24-oyl-CoA dehydrogenase
MAWTWMAEKSITALSRSLRTLGGYGLSLEYDMHLYHRRASGYVLLGGDREKSLEQAGNRLFLNEEAPLPQAGPCAISFDLDEAAIAAGNKAADFIRAQQTPAMRQNAHHSTASHDPSFHRKLAQAGYIAAGLDGGKPESATERFAVLRELEEAGYTTHVIATTELVGKVVDRFGTAEAIAEIVASIKAGDAVGALGFSEPGAGSDVFAAQTQAIRQGKKWLINGKKMFTTAGHLADYILLLARSEPGSQGHKGLTLFVVPTALPGFSHQSIHTYQDERTNITFFTDLELPDHYRLGEAGAGSYVMGEALKLEQSAATILFHGQAVMIQAARRWAQQNQGNGAPADSADIRRRLAEILTRFEVAHCFVARDLWAADQGLSDRSFGPMSKLFVTQSHLENGWQVLQMAGPQGLLTGTHPLGVVELGHRRAYAETIYGGTNEIHRSLIAEQALGLPKSRT